MQLKHKNFTATIDYDETTEIFHGHVPNTTINFNGKEIKELMRNFKKATRKYLYKGKKNHGSFPRR